MSENDLLLAIKAGMVIRSAADVLECLVQLAALHIEAGRSQEAADILAYVLHQHDTPQDIQAAGQELWDGLASWVCPRVLLDAEDFGTKAALEDVVEYVLL